MRRLVTLFPLSRARARGWVSQAARLSDVGD
jgi:hypothetical protein